MNSELITIVFSLPTPIKKELMDLNRQLSEKYKTFLGSEFPTYTPHITIYQAEFPKKNEKEVLQVIKSLASTSEAVSFVPIGIKIKGRYVSLGLEDGGEAERFHKKLIEKLNPLREGNIKDSYKISTQNLTKEEQKNIDEWGYPYVMNLYRPHLTVLALADEKDATEVSRAISWSKSFLVNTITTIISGKDEQGAKLKIVREFHITAKNW